MIGSYRVLLLLGSLSLFWAAGCTSPMTSTGWNFTVGKPATMIAPAAIAQGPSTLAMYPVAAMPSSAPRGASLAATGPDCGPCPPAVGAGGGTGGTLAALGLACDLNSICTRLDRIERRLGNPAVGLPPPRPLPPGSSSELHP